MSSGIFAKIPRERLAQILENLHKFLSLPIQLIDDTGTVVLSFGSPPRYCTLLQKNMSPPKPCLVADPTVGHRALKLGEPYIFPCHANLNHIACPLIHQKELLGCIYVGPFLMDAPDSTLISGLAELHGMSPALSLELYDELSGIPVVAPAKVNQLSKLLEHLLLPLLPAEQAMLKQNQEKLYQQSKINEAIQMFKEQSGSTTHSFFYEKERELLSKVRTGDLSESKALLNELIGFVLFSEGGKLETVRVHAVELTTLLSRVAIDGGASADSVYTLNRQFIALMSRENSLDQLCSLLQSVVESFVDAAFNNQDRGNLRIRRALQYISANYMNRLTLAAVAEQVGLSASHFSMLFTKTVGRHFSDYLSSVRIEAGKRLLQSTDYPLAQIAAAIGFSDQSSFCKAFKKETGISPGKYRN